MSDTLPNDPYVPPNSSLHLNGPWSLVQDEVISQVVSGGSPILNWLPTRGVNWKTELVQHLSWVAPESMDGSITYGESLNALEAVDECNFQHVPMDWQTCVYALESNRMSFSSGKVNQYGLNYREYENSPRYVLRGPNAGMMIDNDYAWAMTVAAYQADEHLKWNVWYGNPTAFQNTSYGLESVIAPGFVSARKRGPGNCDFTDPDIYSGIGKSVREVIDLMRTGFRKIYQRGLDRGYTLQQRDVAFVMSRAHWNTIADYLAWNLSYDAGLERTRLSHTIESLDARRARLTTPVPGVPESSGYIPLPEMNVPVIIDDQLGRNALFGVPAQSAVTGDIYLLTRFFAGMPILEHQFLDYNELFRVNNLQPNRDRFVQQNGMIQVIYLEENRICFSIGLQMETRIIPRMQPMQMRINDVTFSTILPNEIEASSFTHPNYYPYGGQTSGVGSVLITGLR